MPYTVDFTKMNSDSVARTTDSIKINRTGHNIRNTYALIGILTTAPTVHIDEWKITYVGYPKLVHFLMKNKEKVAIIARKFVLNLLTNSLQIYSLLIY